MIDWFFLIAILSLIVYRVSRFVILDSLIEGTRDKITDFLERRSGKLVYAKLLDLLGCPFCITIWVSAGAVAITDYYLSVPMPVWTWLAASAGALVTWGIVDSEESHASQRPQ